MNPLVDLVPPPQPWSIIIGVVVLLPPCPPLGWKVIRYLGLFPKPESPLIFVATQEALNSWSTFGLGGMSSGTNTRVEENGDILVYDLSDGGNG